MAELTYREAVSRAIAQEMERDPTVYFIGEDVAAAGGVFKTTEGLMERFGPNRVRDTPISEQAIIGAVMGAAMNGLRPIAELMFSDFFAVCWDLIANQIAKTRYMTDGQVALPLVIRTASGFQSVNALMGPADQWRQDSQWQYPIAAGAPVTSNSTSPQKQRPV